MGKQSLESVPAGGTQSSDFVNGAVSGCFQLFSYNFGSLQGSTNVIWSFYMYDCRVSDGFSGGDTQR